MTTALSLKNVSKQFGGLAAVRGVNLEIKEGGIVGLIGPNGAGKTTLVNLITGTERESSGEMSFYGTKINGEQPYARAKMGIARTYQVVRVFKELTVLENVVCGLLFGQGQNRLSKQIQEQANDLLEFTGLKGKETQRAINLNLGDQKRLQIARALAMKPRLLILDEAMSGLNPKEVEDAIELVRKISAQKVTIIIIEHILKVIMSLSERIVVMGQGEVIYDGIPSDIVNNQRVIEVYFGNRFANKVKSGGIAL